MRCSCGVASLAVTMRVREPLSVVTTRRTRALRDMTREWTWSGSAGSWKAISLGSEARATGRLVERDAVLGLVGESLGIVPLEIAGADGRHTLLLWALAHVRQGRSRTVARRLSWRERAARRSV